jgi:hypothetical protein
MRFETCFLDAAHYRVNVGLLSVHFHNDNHGFSPLGLKNL